MFITFVCVHVRVSMCVCVCVCVCAVCGVRTMCPVFIKRLESSVHKECWETPFAFYMHDKNQTKHTRTHTQTHTVLICGPLPQFCRSHLHTQTLFIQQWDSCFLAAHSESPDGNNLPNNAPGSTHTSEITPTLVIWVTLWRVFFSLFHIKRTHRSFFFYFTYFTCVIKKSIKNYY